MAIDYDGSALLFHDVHDETPERQHDVRLASIPKSRRQRLFASDSARKCLDKRYASDGISSEEYEEKKRNLNQI
jgi:hypothetical protein